MLGLHSVELIVFMAGVIVATWLDLAVLHRDNHDIDLKEAAKMTAGWVLLALAFSGYVYWQYGGATWMEFITGYTLEEALSIDNIFVIALLFNSFNLSGGLQHRALAWGIIGAMLMRAILIFLGVGLITKFNWILPLFGLILLFTAIKMLRPDSGTPQIVDSKLYRWITKVLPVFPGFDGNRIMTRSQGRVMITTLGVAIVMVELTDLIFAVDSIPAVMGVSRDPFIILTSNIFAVLGLRALYFLLKGILHKFRFLKPGLAAILAFIGGKMLMMPVGIEVPIGVSLAIVLGVVVLSVVASLFFAPNAAVQPAEAHTR